VITATSDASKSRDTAEPAEIVRSFLLALEAGDLEQAMALLADDVLYINVSLPAIRGRARIERLFRRALERWHAGFRVHFHTLAANGPTVLTERTDELILGPVKQRIWVYGRFDVVNGQITLWRDSFDWLDVLVGLLRGLAGVLSPALNRAWPGNG
jgi:limonene-1,2-epoxide hydrolase